MKRSMEDRFWEKVDRSGECWVWMARLGTGGYGQFRVGERQRSAHRVAYELLIGPIPEGRQLDHLCRNRRCVNPRHLDPVTSMENIRRGLTGATAGARMLAKTHCPQGHPYDAANTYRMPTGGRACRTCRRTRDRDSKLAKRSR